MLKKVSFYLLILVIFSFKSLVAQGFDLNEFIPNSPTTSQFEEIVSPVVNQFSGKADINIPIYNVVLDDFVLPINLSYDSGGFLVGKQSTWVGDSWSLLAGGVITRNQISLPDDISNDIINSNVTYPVQNPISGEWSAASCSSPTISDPAGWLYKHESIQESLNDCEGQSNCYVSERDGGVDIAPDIFNISLVNKVSSKFFFSNPNRVDFLDKSNLKLNYEIENEDEGISRFEVYDDKGNQYIFEEREYLRYQRDYWNTGRFRGLVNESRFNPIINGVGVIPYTNFWSAYNSYACQNANYDPSVEEYMNRLWPKAWYITKIITSKGKTIDFEYDREEYYTLGVSQVSAGYLGASTSGQGYPYWIFGFSNTNRLQHIDAPRLKKIVWSTGEVVFNAFTSRQDIYENSDNNITHNTKKLDEIIVSDLHGNQIKKVVFNHSYNLAENYSETLPVNKKAIYKRLWLNSIDVYNKDGIKMNGYDFSYDNTVLPNKYSFEQDYWGYYNNNNADSFIPDLWFYPEEEIDYVDKGKVSLYPRLDYNGLEERSNDYVVTSNQESFNVADRRPNDVFSKAGVLSKISYFLGGEIEYEYEGNQFLYRGETVMGPGIRIKRTLLKESDLYLPIITDYNYDFNGETTGKIASLPVFTGNRYQISSHPYNSIDLSLNSDFGYTRIEKAYLNGDFGKEVTEYSFPVQLGTTSYQTTNGNSLYESVLPDIFSESIYPPNLNGERPPPYNPLFPYAFETSLSMARGKLLSKKVFDNSGVLVQNKIIEYDFHSDFNITKASFSSKLPIAGAVVRYLSADYHEISQETTLDNVTSTINYEYNDRHQLSSINTINSDGNIIEEIYKYPSDFHSIYSYFDTENLQLNSYDNVYKKMTDRNMLDYPIETIRKVNDNVESSQIVSYKEVYNEILPYKIYSLETNQFSYNYTYATSTGININMDNNMVCKLSFDRYREANLQEYKETNDIENLIIWGYNHTKPIAIIEGVGFAEMNTWFSLDYGETLSHISDISNENSNITSELSIQYWLGKLRTSIQNHRPLSRIRTFTYIPLVGVSSITDSKTITEIF